MRVGIVYPIEFGHGGHMGGGERYAFELARALADQVETRLITFGRGRNCYRNGNLRVEVFPQFLLVRGFYNNPFNPLFLQALRDVDVIHCIGWHVLPTDLAILFARATGKRVFATDVGGGADFSLQRFLPLGRLLHRFLFLTRYAASLYPQFTDRAVVIYGGVDPVKFSPGPIPKQRKVLYVGRIIPAKGIEYVIEAVDPEIPLTILGQPYHADYYHALRQRAVGRNVRFITDANDARLVEEYRSSRVTVLSHVKRSAYGSYDVPNVLGLTLLESMACGTPVVCTDAGPEPELVQDGVTGFVVPPNDAAALRERLNQLLAQPGLARRMGGAARARVLENFTWDAAARRCLKAYRGETVSNDPRPHSLPAGDRPGGRGTIGPN